MAEIVGYQSPGTMVPFDTNAEAATHDALYGKGGYRTVDSIADRNAIPVTRLSPQMLVGVVATGLVYKLNNTFSVPTISGDWTVFGAGGGGGVAIGDPVTGGSGGSVLFIDIAGNLSQDNPGFTWDGSTFKANGSIAVPSGQLIYLDGGINTYFDLNAGAIRFIDGGDLVADWRGSLLTSDIWSGLVVHKGGFLLHDNATTSVDWQSNHLADNANIISLDWSNRTLIDTGGLLSVNWQTREIYHLNGLSSIDWENNQLNDGIGDVTAVDWGQRLLNDNVAVTSLAWNARQTYDNGNLLSIDWDQRQLWHQFGGGVKVMDWLITTLYDINAKVSIDWGGRVLTDSAGISVLPWDSRHLANEVGTGLLFWTNDRVGIGTNAAATRLEVAGALSFIDGPDSLDPTLYEIVKDMTVMHFMVPGPLTPGASGPGYFFSFGGNDNFVVTNIDFFYQSENSIGSSNVPIQFKTKNISGVTPGGIPPLFNFNMSGTTATANNSGSVAQTSLVVNAPTYASDVATLTLTTASTMYIDSAPIAGANTVIQKGHALWLGSSLRVDGDGTNVFYLPTDGTGNVSAATGRVAIDVGGVTQYLRYYND